MTHTYTIARPLARPTVHELMDGSPVPVFGRGTTYRQGSPLEVIMTDMGHGPVVLVGSQAYLVSGPTVAELDAYAQEDAEAHAFDRAYDAQLAEAKRLGSI